MSTNSPPPSLPLPAPVATRRGRAMRVQLFTARQRNAVILLCAALAIAALCAAYL